MLKRWRCLIQLYDWKPVAVDQLPLTVLAAVNVRDPHRQAAGFLPPFYSYLIALDPDRVRQVAAYACAELLEPEQIATFESGGGEFTVCPGLFPAAFVRAKPAKNGNALLERRAPKRRQYFQAE